MALKYDMRVWNGIILWNDRANNNEQILKNNHTHRCSLHEIKHNASCDAPISIDDDLK